MRAERGRRAALGWALCAALLAACDGGGRSPETLSGRVQRLGQPTATAWTVCLDLDQDFDCGPAEPRTQADGDGRFTLELPAGVDAAGALIAARGDDGSGTGQRLAAPAGAGLVTVFSTLIALQWKGDPAAGLGAAQRRLQALLMLAADADLLNDGEWTQDPALERTAAALHDGVQAALPGLPAAGPGALAGLLTDTLARYLEPGRGRLLPGVGGRTLAHEIGQTLQPTACRVEPPPTLRIATDGAAPIVSKDAYVGARLQAEAGANGGDALDLRLAIRGRGNSTWTMPKKPYRLKLDAPAALLDGAAADRDWALLANYSDKSLLRNAVALCLGRKLGMDFTPADRFVELELNGEYQGVYQLVEHVKAAAGRVDIGQEAATAQDPGGFLLEIDSALDEDFWFLSSPMDLPYTVKSDTDAATVPLIEQVIAGFEARLLGAGFADPDAGYAAALDVESLVDFYLVNELMRNNDAFYASTFVHRKDRGKLVFGPLWDFDIAAGNIDYNGNDAAEGWWVRGRGYLPRLFDDPHFVRQVAARWQFLSRQMPDLQRFIRQGAEALDAAQQRNFAAWDILNLWIWPNAVVTGSYAGEVDYLQDWLARRSAWLDREWALAADGG
ncbi:MAG: CotH kinase family protein [Rubrivivax sp.]